MDRYLQPKITDFYFPKQIQENRNSIIYYPPEFLKNNEYSKSTDVYSFGIILYEILTAEKPFQDLSIFKIYNEVVSNGCHPTFSKPVKEIYKNLIERCLSQNPEKRPTFQKIVKDLKSNRSYITNSIRKKDFMNYIKFIESNKKCVENRDKCKSILFLGHFDEEQISLVKEVVNLDGKSNYEKEIFDKNQPDIHKFIIEEYKCDVWTLVYDVKPTIYLQNLIRKVNIILFTFNLNEPKTLDFLMKGWFPIIEKVENQTEKQERFLIGIYPKESKANEYNLSEIYSKIVEIKEQLNITKYFEYGTKPKSLESPIEFDIEISQELIKYLSDNLDKEEKCSSEEEEFIENDVVYKLIKKDQIAEIIESPKAEGEINISKFLKYETINIASNSFSKSLITIFQINNESKIINISENSFSGCQNLKFISFKCKETLNIEESSFSELKSLETIFIDCPKVNIGECCFMKCKLLSSIVLENVYEIDISNQGFSKCESLKELSMSTLSKIELGQYCFSGCKNLSSIEFSSEQITIEESCFENCFSLSLLSFPSVDELKIGSNSFDKCININQISILKSRSVYFGHFCFQNITKLTNIEINTDQLTFDENCFSECNSLQSLNFQNVKNILFYPRSFNKCSNLRSISITNACYVNFAESCFNELNNLSTIRIQCNKINYSDIEKLIKSCTSLTTFILDTVQPITITQETFQNCLSLSELDINSENSITFTKRCFFNSKNIKIIRIKSKEIKIEEECFSLSSIQSIIIESTKLDILYRSFSNCSNLSSIIFNNIQSIYICRNVFTGCSSLKNIEISATSRIILNDNCFTGTQNIEKIKLNSKEVIIYDRCFYNCLNFKTLLFEGVQNAKIDSNVFVGCDELKNIDISTTSKVELNEYCFDGIRSLESITINAAELISNKSFRNNSLTTIYIINVKNMIINSETFHKCLKLKEIYIYSSEKVIFEEECFNETQSLENITISSKEISFLGKCFKNHKNLTKISIENSGIVTIGSNSFIGCSKFKNIEIIAESEIRLCKNCICGCLEFETITLESKKVIIEERSFINCSKFKSINLNNVQSIDIRSNAFESCSQLKNINIKTENEIHLQNYCFFSAQNLEMINLNSKEVIIGDHCFKMCKKLSSIHLNEVENATIGQDAFEGCDSLIGINIKVKSNLTICDFCFSNTNNLSDIVLSGDYLKIGRRIFKDCHSLEYASLESFQGSETSKESFIPRKSGSVLDLTKLKGYKP